MTIHVFYYPDDGSVVPGKQFNTFDSAIFYIESLQGLPTPPDEEPELTENEYAEQEKSSHLHP